MSSSSPPFIALAVGGHVELAQIDDFVDRWHDENEGRHLHDYLGLTRAEYALWLVEPDMLSAIVMARAEGVPLPVVVHGLLADRRQRDVSANLERDERLDRWLAQQVAH